MLTLKQLEALVWIDRLGSFAATADRLRATPSAISKRISEIESTLGADMIERTQLREKARLTSVGKEVVLIGAEMLRLRDQIVEKVGTGSGPHTSGRLRVGVTELVALSFLRQLIVHIRESYPFISIEPEIDVSTRLLKKLDDSELDFVICPALLANSRFQWVKLDTVEFSWMASPTFPSDKNAVTSRKALTLEEILAYPIIVQIGTSGVDALYDRWFQSRGVEPTRVHAGNSLAALSSLTIGGFGISYLPTRYFSDLVANGSLAPLQSAEVPPAVDYYAIFRKDGPLATTTRLATLAQAVCNFGRPE